MKKVILLILLVFASLVTIHAGTTGSIMGFILDQDTGVPIEEVKVTIVEIGFSTGSDMSGLFMFAGLPVGMYSLLIEKLGYQPVTVEGIVVSIDQTTTISVELKEAPIEIKTPIIILADRVLLNKNQIGALTKIDHTQIIDMSSRDIFRAAQIAPGVVTNEDGQMKVRGTRESNTTFLMDGLSIMDPFHNTFGAVVSAKGVMGEVNVITGGFDAEYGNALGGVINTVTRNPETNDYSFNADFNTSNAIPDWFGDATRYRLFGEEEYNFEFEGPVPFVPDNKLGFLLAGQAFYADSSTSSGFQNKDYEEFHDYHFKLDYKISPTDRLQYHTEYGFAWIRIKMKYEALGYSGWPIQHQSNRYHHLLYNRTISNDTYFKLAISYFHSGIDFGARDVDSATGAESYYEIKPFEELAPGDYYAHQRSRHTNTEIRFDLSSDTFTGHNLKLGFDIQRVHTDLYWGVFMLDTAYLEFYPFEMFYPAYFYLEDHIHEYYQTNGYIQDKWDITDALLLSYGLRFDYWGYLETDNLKFQPRVGVNYQITPSTLVRGSFSLMYQAPPVEAVYEEDSGASWYLGYDFDWGDEAVEPEGATNLELGIQQSLGKDYLFEASVFKKWLDDVVSTYYDPVIDKEAYSNVATAHVEGLELTFKKVFSNYFEGWITYTLMEAKGKNMQYNWYDEISKDDPNYGIEYYLDYDQRHTVNANLLFKSEWAFFNIIWRYGSGYPYTPHDAFKDYGRDGTQKKDANLDGDYTDIGDGDIPPDADGSEGDGIYEEGESTYATDPANVWNSERYPAYSRIDVKVKFRLPMNWFGGHYWFNITCRNLLDHFNLRGAGGNDLGDIDPYTGKPWSYATGGTGRRYTWGLEIDF